MPYPTSLIRRFLSSCRTSIVEMRQPNVGISHSLKMFSGNSFVTGTMLVGSAERIAILTWLVVALAVAQLTYGQTYTITSMPAWSAASGAVSLPTGINNTGQIVGYYYSGSTQLPVGFLFDRASKAYTSLAYPGATETWATAVNDSGVVVGYYTTDPPSTVNSVHAFSYSQGAFANIDPSASSSAFVYGIDNTGDYVGLFLPASQSNYVGFISVAGSVSVLAPPAGFGDAFPRGINNLGQIVGYMYPSSSTSEGLKCTSQCGFLLNGAQYEILKGESSSIFVEAAAINDYGEVVGYTEADSLYDPYIGFVFYGGSYVASPNAACAGSTYLRGINNSGEIVGYCLDGESFGFLATPSVSPSSISKQLGQCGCSWNLGEPQKGDPITLGNGNLFEQAEDYRTSGTNPLVFARYYNSLSSSSNPPTFATTLGTNWRSNYDRYLRLITTGGTITGVIVERPDGKALNFTLNGSVWTSDTDVDIKLTESGSTWTLADHDDTVETYAVNSAGEGLLQAIQARNGYTQTLAYNSSNQLQSVTDTYGRSLNLTFSGGLLETVTTPDNLVLTYGMTAVTGGNQLTSVSYNTNPSSSQTYLYGNASFPFAMTGITDEDGNQFATWTYDSSGRATSSQHGTGADLTTVVYNSDGTTTVANALGVADTYTFQTLQGVPKVTQISRAATSTTGAATEIFTYDNNGYMASKTDWNGNRTTYVNDAHGDPTTINEAVGTGAARTTAIAYDSTWVHLPASVTTSGVTTTYTYDSSGEQLTRTLTDTTISTAPYSTSGQARTWTNKWSNYLLGSVKTPNGNTTKYTFDGSGALTSITDAKGHVTNITSHTGGGYPTTIVDPNNVTTTLTYDPRLRLTSSTVSGTEGTYKASWSYDAAGNLITTTLPDNSFLTNAYDTAHRLTKVTDALGNYTGYTLDALGDRTQTNIYSASGTVTWRRSGTFDALGRLLIDTAGAGQTTTRTFDPNGNVLTVTDGLNYTTTNTYDALNRLSTSTDANSGVTTPAYDAHDRIVSVTDANGNTTGYTRDGFGDVIQQTSPDSGVTVYSYDGDANLTSKTDARGIVTNQTFDALDRPLTTTYPADGSENVAYTYDQTGSGFAFGIGRLTSVTDAAGSLTRQYEERGNLANETRVNGTTTLFTSYTYDGASRIASITYPDGTLVSYQRDAAGYVSKVTAQLPGATSGTTIATMTHLPFGPVNSASYGNGVAENWTYDNDYRATNIADALSGTGLQNLRYAYDNANNVSSITDAVNPANSQTLGYDVINRLINAASGSGGYGGFTWTYDKVGNRLTEVQGSTATTYGYTPGTNRLTTITMGTTTASLKIPTQIKRVHNSPGSMLNARMPNSSISTPRSAGRHNPARQASPALSAILGWPMILAGFTVIAGFRKRLLKSRWLALLPLALVLTGASKILSGCGGGGTSTQLNPTTTTATPTFSPAAGTYSAAQTVTISDSTSGAAIYYTTDGSTPTANSTKYSGPITVSSTETIQAIAVATGSTSSAVATATYTISASQQTATPVFSPPGGSYTSAQSVTISDATPGTTIYYTTDGSTPTASSTAYTGPITVSATETIKAIAVASGYANSAVATATYTISAEQQAATPTFGPAGGTYTSAQNVAIFDATTGATIYYTTDGSTPTTSSTAYSGSITVSATETIKAIAAASGYSNSAVATATYTINILPPADIPTFSPGGGTYTSAQSVTISDATTGATIYYTDNLSIPTNNWPIYTGPITVNTTEILAAYAVAPGYAASSIKEADFTITLLPQAAAPTFSPAGGAYTSAQSVTISDATTGATIYYTTDGSTPTTSSSQYSGAIPVSSTETIEAIASASGYANSNVATASYTINVPTALPVSTSADGNITSLPLSVMALSSATTDADRRALVAMTSNGNSSTATAMFTYNNANRLASVTGTPLAATFVYDWAGQRFSKTDNGETPTLYSYLQGGTLIAENDNGTVTDYVYAEGRPIAVLQPQATTAANQVNYVHADGLGTPQVITNSSGSAVWSTTYQPFGTTGVLSAAINQNLRFPGQNFDAETGFNYNLNRDYMPNLGRYLETDPIGLAGGINSYIYALGNPVDLTDARGLDAVFFGISIGGQAGWQLNPNLSSGQSDFYGLGISYSYYGYIPVPNDIGFVISDSTVDRYQGIGYGIAASATANFCTNTLVDLETKPGDQPSRSFDVDFGGIGPIGGFSYDPSGSSVAFNVGLGGRSILGFGFSSNTTEVYSLTRWINSQFTRSAP